MAPAETFGRTPAGTAGTPSAAGTAGTPSAAGTAGTPSAAGTAGTAAAPAAAAQPVAACHDDVAVLLLAEVNPASRAWGWWRIVRGAGGLGAPPGLRFAKVMGSGHEGGFGLRPSPSRQGLFAVFEGADAARRFAEDSPLVRAYRARSLECCVLVLRAWSSRGRWSGQALDATLPAPAAGSGPIAALTRASIRPTRALRFWSRAPAAQRGLEGAPGCRLAVGLGEAPLLRQATFSLWDSVAAMDAYARSGAHLEAIRASQRERHFSESMFVRFVPLSVQGRWKGVDLG